MEEKTLQGLKAVPQLTAAERIFIVVKHFETKSIGNFPASKRSRSLQWRSQLDNWGGGGGGGRILIFVFCTINLF